MRFRFWALIVVGLLLVAVAGCAGGRSSVAPTPVPTKTLRPIFTNTPVVPTVAPATATPQNPPTATPQPTPVPPTPEPPTAEPPTATPEPATFTVSSATVNIRNGPGTNYTRIGQVRQGQTFGITGKNAAGDWWQFDYNGQRAWIIGRLVAAKATGSVQVAADIPAPPPTARPQPTAKPKPTQPPPTAAPTYRFASSGVQPRPNSNPLVTVWCRAFNSARTAFVPGAIRVTMGGSTLAEAQFIGVENRGDPGLDSEFIYNQGCKVELPLVAGAYSAYLIEGGQQASDAIEFTVVGETRIFILTWVQK